MTWTTYDQLEYKDHQPGARTPFLATAVVDPIAVVDPNSLPDRRKRQAWKIMGMTTLGVLVVVIPLAAWVWFIFVHEHTTIDRSALQVYSTANPTRLLLLSTISVTVSKLLVGPLMAMHAYASGVEWLRASAAAGSTAKKGARLPTPVHLGTLSSLYQGARIVDIYSALRVKMRSPKYLPWPRMLLKALCLLVWLVGLSAGIAALDLWLHLDATVSTSVPTSSAFAGMGYNDSTTLFSRTINQTYCAERNTRQTLIGQGSCGLSDGSATTLAFIESTARLISMNNSDDHRVAWLDDDTAILVPYAIPAIGYRGEALGIKTTCESITQQCVQCNDTASDVPLTCVGPEAGPLVECTGPVLLNATDVGGGAVVNVTTGEETSNLRDANPVPYAAVLRSRSYFRNGIGNAYYVGNTGFLRKSRMAVNVVYCHIGVYDVVYEFAPPGQYTVQSAKLSDVESAAYVAKGLGNWEDGVTAVDGTGLRGNETFIDVYSRELSKLSVALVASTIGRTPATQLLPGRTTGARMTLIGLLLSLLLDACMIITTIVVGAQAAITILSCENRFFVAARGRLLSTYPLIGDSLGGLAYDFQTHKHAISGGLDDKSFRKETEADRLVLEPQVIVDDEGVQRTLRLLPRRL